ncbi:hypothetical protein GPALN_014622 [Globodera pallida]|nr:hypothetical protein GPALN_014622 [Globodera pallida]
MPISATDPPEMKALKLWKADIKHSRLTVEKELVWWKKALAQANCCSINCNCCPKPGGRPGSKNREAHAE